MKTRKRNASCAAFIIARPAGRSQARPHSVTVVVPYPEGDGLKALLARYGFEQGIEVFQAGIFDDDASATVLVFDRNLQTQGSLQRIPRFANIRIERCFLFFFTLRFLLRVEQSLHITFRLAY